MASAGRRLRPLAVLCALVMVAWGAASAASLVAQIMTYDDLGLDENADGEVWAWVWLHLAAAASGVWVGVWGLFGLAWRPPLHLAALSLLVAVGLEVAANVVQVNYFSDLGAPVSYGDQVEWYVDRVTFDTGGAVESEGRAFVTALPMVTAVLPLLAWLVVLFSGAGRKRRPAPVFGAPAQYQQPYPQPQPQPYQPQPYQPQPYQQPYPQQHQPPPYPQQRPQPRPDPPTRVLPEVPPQRPVPRAPVQPTDHETQPYQRPPEDR